MAKKQPQPCHRDESLRGLGQRPVPVDQLFDNRVDGTVLRGGSQPAIGLQPEPVTADVVRRQMSVDREVDPNIPRFLNGRNRFTVRSRAVCFNRFADQPHVEIETDTCHVSGLFGTEHVSRAPDLEILHRHSHASAELVVLRDRGQPVVCRFGERNLRRIQEIRVTTFATATHPTTQLM